MLFYRCSDRTLLSSMLAVSAPAKTKPLLHGCMPIYKVRESRCWFAPEDLRIGDKFWHRNDESIKVYDKLLVVLSQNSVDSEWVEQEVMAALEKEKQDKKTVLFPITLDEAFKQADAPCAADIRRTRHVGDIRRHPSLF